MNKKNKGFCFFLMHLGFLLYSFYTVLGKLAADYVFFSKMHCVYYVCMISVLFVYAIIWQQVLKKIELSVATANKASTVIWGLVWGNFLFKETITGQKIIGALIIFVGILILSFSKGKKYGE